MDELIFRLADALILLREVALALATLAVRCVFEPIWAVVCGSPKPIDAPIALAPQDDFNPSDPVGWGRPFDRHDEPDWQ